MEPFILDRDFNRVGILDRFESLLWTERFMSYGDFEIYTAVTLENVTKLQEGYYLQDNTSEQVMIIEDIEINANSDVGNHLIVTGRSLESILDRRIVWVQTILDGYLQGQVEKLLNQNAINPDDPNRKIPGLIFKQSTDERITSLKVSIQFTGDNLYDAIKVICDTAGIGFRITLNEDNQFVFELYMGEDRSYDQMKNPYVIFSPNFDNLINSNYLQSKKTLKTVTLVAGEEQGTARRTTTVYPGEDTATTNVGLDRRELYTDARDISSTVEDRTLTNDEYTALLVQRGTEKLAENVEIKTFEGQIESRTMFVYGKDYFRGDIVQVSNEYGIDARSRISEVIHSESTEGVDVYPTFELLE